jgi:hypothetical protein
MWSDLLEEYLKGILWMGHPDHRVRQVDAHTFVLEGGHAPHHVRRAEKGWLCRIRRWEGVSVRRNARPGKTGRSSTLSSMTSPSGTSDSC